MPTSTEEFQGSDGPEGEAEDLLRRVLRDPFQLEPSDAEDAEDLERHVSDWFTYLIQNFPLWSFQAARFASYHPADLPSAHPLGLIVESLFRDDGIDPNDPRVIEPLLREVQARRYRLNQGKAWHWSFLAEERLVLPGGSVSSSAFSYLMEDTGESPYDDPGRILSGLIEERDSKASAVERSQVQETIDDYLVTLGARRRPHRAPILPPDLLRGLVAEGTRIVEICWAVLPVSMSSRTHSLLSPFLEGVGDDEDSGTQLGAMNLWRRRLALPILSTPELLALDDPTGNGRDALLVQERVRLKSRRLAIWMLARRLRLDAATISRSAVNARDSENFRDSPNPVDAFVS
jgi:hypothetical protein